MFPSHDPSSEMFGGCIGTPFNENTSLIPASPYAAAKVFAHNMAKVYRESYGLHISCAINFNHDSERRGQEFLTRKVTKAVAEIKAGHRKILELGNLDTQRDFTYAPEVMRAAWLMLQQAVPSDYVISSGEAHSMKEFVDKAFKLAGLAPFDRDWET